LRVEIARKRKWLNTFLCPLGQSKKAIGHEFHALPLIKWMTVRLDVSEDEWRRRNHGMEPQGRGNVPALHAGTK
jgi:hypothetical protein